MAFGQELKDFVSGFKTGYEMVDSKEDKEWKRDSRRMQKESHERTGIWHDEDRAERADERNYRRGRDTVGDAQWNKSWEFRQDQADWQKQRDGASDERYLHDQEFREKDYKLRENNYKLDRARQDGAIPDNSDIPDAADPYGGIQNKYEGSDASDPSSWLKYSNHNATRSQPISPKLETALAQIAPSLGLQVEVFSGGQNAKGKNRTGSHRHDHGGAADVFIYKDGRKLDWANPDDRPVFEELVKRGKEVGLTGFGAGQGYMQPGSMHLGFGTPAVWGAGGSGENAAGWLKKAYAGNYAAGGMVSAIPDDMEEEGTGAPAGLFTVAIEEEPEGALPEEGPTPTPRPDFEGASEGQQEEPTDDPYEQGRRAVRDGLNQAIKNAGVDQNAAIDDPELEKMRQNYIRGYGAAPSQMMRQVMDKIDPDRKMAPGERNMLAMGTVHRYYMEKGDMKQAQEAAASMIQYYRKSFQQFSALAQAAAEKGDVSNAAKAAVAAYANVPNGRDLDIKENEDGTLTISVTNSKSGEQIVKQVMNPRDFAAAAMQFNPTTFDDEIMTAAGEKADTYDDASLEDLGKVSEEIRGTIEADFAESGLTKEGMAVIEDIATDIAKVKQNGVAPSQAVRLAAGMLDAGDDVEPKSVRGHPDLVRVEFGGQSVVMSKGQFKQLNSVRSDKAKRAADQETEAKETSARRSEQYESFKKAAGAFSDAITDPGPSEVQGRNKQRHENIQKARSNFGAIPDGSEETAAPAEAPAEAIPVEQDTEASFNNERIQELLQARDNAIARAKASKKDPKQFGLDDINAALAELGYTEAAAK